ncbi:Bro-N domain-containing protein [Paremcibacter congregatus]|uniref:BRO-N domain-containing protein n=1 Tax=Paremcibacter congregatus TaxID=2043170 RepID=UPI003A90E7B7
MKDDAHKVVVTSILTVGTVGRIVRPIGGKNPPWGPSNSLFQTVSRHVSYGYFCARISGASSRLWREGGEYNTLRGNKPACLWTGLKPPATSAVLQSLIGGVVKRRPEGFDMTKHDNGRNLPAKLTFIDTELSIIDRDGVPWLTGADMARALGCARTDIVANLYRRNKAEFTDQMAQHITVMGRGQIAPTKHWIFSPRGAQLIAMLAKTDRAKAFRRWVLDVLENQAQPGVAHPPEPVDMAAFRHQVVDDVVAKIMGKIGPHIPAAPTSNLPARTMPPMTNPDDPMPRLMDGHAMFRIGERIAVVDTSDYALSRGDRAVVIRIEDGEFPQIVTVLDQPPVKGWFDRCMVFSSGVPWYIPVGAVLGRVVWEGVCCE